MEKITRDLKVSGIYCIENKLNHKTYKGEDYIKKENLILILTLLLCMFMT
jgi:hypothetical protein